MRIFLALALITLPLYSYAAPPRKTHHKPVHRIQQHYSFIPPRPVAAASPKKADPKALTGQVQQISQTAEPLKLTSHSPLALHTPDQSITAPRKPFSLIRHFWKHRISATPSQSAAIPMNANEAAQLSTAAIDMIASLNKTDTPIFLLPSPKSDTQSDTFTPSLIHNLRDTGFKLSSESNELSTPVRYRVSHYQNTYLVHITVKSIQLARLFKVINGSLIATSPLSSTKEQP